MNLAIPEKCLSQHVAILGKTGSGKTSTEKLIVEQIVAEGYRVCILDAVKSDWWGITSSADGKKPGLPFKILGGPHGHVPLHSSAGAVIGQLVGSGKLPLSIIDMSDFEAGGLQRFFIDFAPALMRGIKGVLYLVIEEAHEFAPKERSGFGGENMAIHWAKKLATAGRSKGIRLIVATQRVQSLHNAVLGSCETLIAHRLSAPADQEPILKWLKANADKETSDKVARSISSLSTGTGWLCSGEARLFQKMEFPKFKTFDNAATPMKDGEDVQVKTAPVDQEELRSIIGDAVKIVEENDPKLLKKRIEELEKARIEEMRKYPPVTQGIDMAAHRDALDKAHRDGYNQGQTEFSAVIKPIADTIDELSNGLKDVTENLKMAWNSYVEKRLDIYQPQPQGIREDIPDQAHIKTYTQYCKEANKDDLAKSQKKMSAAEIRFLTVLAQRGKSLTRTQIAIFARYFVKSGHVDNTLGSLRSRGWISGGNAGTSITKEGLAALGTFQPLEAPSYLRAAWLEKCDKAQQTFLNILFEIYPKTISRDELAVRAGYKSTSGHVDNSIGRLRSLALAVGKNDAISASPDFF